MLENMTNRREKSYFLNVQIMASKIQVFVTDVDNGQYMTEIYHEKSSEKTCLYIDSIKVRLNNHF